MIDIKFLRKNIDIAVKSLNNRGFVLDVELFNSLDEEVRALKIDVEKLQSERNVLSKEFGILKSTNQNTDDLKVKLEKINNELELKSEILKKQTTELNNFLLLIPNLPSSTTPIGNSEEDNVVVKTVGDTPNIDNPLDHLEISKKIDTITASKLAGSRFSVLKDDMAKLNRALINFMLSEAVSNQYKEYYLPYIANKESLIGTGQLPKFEEDQFKLSNDMYLIPTAEVPLTNIYRNELIEESNLPIRMTSHTPCFRSEAGSYGKDTKGLIRQHQFEKIELVQIVEHDKSHDAHLELLGHAENILIKLNLPYRVVELCTGDLGFSASKTFDIEVWLPSQNQYREISSCSNFSDFQSRRSDIKIKKDNKKQYPHTLNGSALAVGRTLIAIVENNYNQISKTIAIPKVLQSFMGCSEIDA